MGQGVCESIEGAADIELAGRADPELSQPVDAAWLDGLDVVVDFSTPDSAEKNIRACIAAGVHAVVGTSGWDLDAVRSAAQEARNSGAGANVFFAPNFAIGAVLMMRFAAEAVRHMPEAEIIELHHDRKLDAPSGTAKRTAELITEAGGNLHQPIHSVRLPGLVAHQEVLLGGEGQTLSIRHDSIDRSSFMAGVLLAVRAVGGLEQPLTVGLEALL
jgi:4-hydroxy-tetrahydrodipicolinate reductase